MAGCCPNVPLKALTVDTSHLWCVKGNPPLICLDIKVFTYLLLPGLGILFYFALALLLLY